MSLNTFELFYFWFIGKWSHGGLGYLYWSSNLKHYSATTACTFFLWVFCVFFFFFKCCRHSNAENADRPSAHWKDQSCCLLYILRAGFVATLEDSSSPKHARCLWKLPQGITGVLSVTLNLSGIDWNPLQSTPSGMTQTTIHWSTWLG